MIFRQLFDQESSTYTYLLGDESSKEALLIDPVDSGLQHYLTLLDQYGLVLKYSLDTHVHADHITASGLLRQETSTLTGIGSRCNALLADLQLQHGDQLSLGQHIVDVLATPGHTAGSVSYLMNDRVFTGDSLMINGCGRTDFQGGDPGTLYDSITGQLFTLPDETLVYPGHDYKGYRVSAIGQEKAINPRLAGKSREEFIAIMNSLDLPKPDMLEVAVPANKRLGIEAYPHG
ncbi:MBL fold metallo-hydrolase [Methylobacillus sp.]|uniref:MBL fold metallo-hydrolase n=1 Tax=Methylobacillus sp. TaxID=56818 RepID=UPI0012D219E3|nr:MBL fold metallo-hydrolase [Methylobacillus sp.]MPS48769.1 MBL fold metallo-hydrolase [Methylobacillus sp.]